MVAPGVFAVCTLCVTTVGCANGDDVVATQSSSASRVPDGGFLSPESSPPCQPGDYAGTLFATPGDGGPQIQYSGRINFTITESLSGEFEVIDDTSHLSGTGDDGSSFQAEIVSTYCKAGVVETTLQNGEYTFHTSLDKSASLTIPFDGTIKGRYEADYFADYYGFIGKWTVALHIGAGYGDLVVTGTWSAARTH